ncbi:MAG: TrkA family potassium uptake protein [Fimbriimonas sp.]
MRDHVIVCGLGQVGYQVTCLLLDLGESVEVITQKAREEWVRHAREKGAKIEYADARDPAALEQAGIAEAKVLVACTSSDSTNIEVGLDAKRLRPDMRVIVRVFDRNLAARLSESFGLETISTAGVAGSAFALAGLGEHAISEFELEGAPMTVVRLEAKEAHLSGKTIAEAAKQIAFPILLKIGANGIADLTPDPTYMLQDGDVVKAVVPSASIRKLQQMEDDTDEFDSLLKVLLRALNPLTLPRLLASMWTNTTPELRAVFVLVNIVILSSVVVFHYGMNLEPIDALYYVITTVTTVGYGDITPIDATVPIKLFSCLLMVLGSASIAISYSIVTDYIVSQRLLQLGGRRRLPHHDHVIVAGLGDVGFRAAEELSASGAKVVLVDSSMMNSHVGVAQRHFPVIVGDARDVAILKTAHGGKAKAIIATTNDDAANLSIGLAAKALQPHIRAVVRIADGEFARKVTAGTNLEAAISAAAVSGPVFAGAALNPGWLTSFVMDEGLVTLARSSQDSPGAFQVGDVWVAARLQKLAST